MNLLDLLILATALAAAAAGARLGFITRAAGWVGMVLGVLAASRLAPALVQRFERVDPTRVLLLTATTLLLGALAGQLAGQVVGQRLGVHARGGWRERADRTAGAVSGLAAVIAAVWLLTPTLTDVPEWPARQARGSLLVSTIDEITPNPPDPLETLSGLVSDAQWERILEGVGGLDRIGPPPGSVAVPDDVQERAQLATVRVEHDGCGGPLDGTGFVAGAQHFVVTNAHVVAGHDDSPVMVYVGNSTAHGLAARVAHFDADQDLAVLYVPELEAEPLGFGETAPGVEGVVWGHPGGGRAVQRPFRIASVDTLATGDIYDEHREVERKVAFVAAKLQRGDSGSALVDSAGDVVGVAWAVAKDSSNVALAATAERAKTAYEDAARRVGANPNVEVGSGRCLTFD